jgi:hypothetical protein
MARNINTFHFDPPHPIPLPLGERGFPDGNYTRIPKIEEEVNRVNAVLPGEIYCIFCGFIL